MSRYSARYEYVSQRTSRQYPRDIKVMGALWCYDPKAPTATAAGLTAADVRHLLAASTKERHHRSQPAADLFDLMIGALLAQRVEVGATALALRHPFAGELAGLDLLQDLLHLGFRAGVDNARATGHVAVLSGVAD